MRQDSKRSRVSDDTVSTMSQRLYEALEIVNKGTKESIELLAIDKQERTKW